MTAINNLRGIVKGVQGKILYKELLPNDLIFVIIKKFLPKRDDRANSTMLEIDCGICLNQLQDSGSVHYFLPSRSSRSVNEPLRQFRTKDGFIVQEHDFGASLVENDVVIKRITEFLIEVPESFLVSLLKIIN